ncbi:glycerate kinase [Rhodospira trueperi]|uniref:Glycerate kinase n=1 Tax=Rhodospira trueperi TaxID=69960 RepID=A0A1G6ZX16_9PROT|nr:glycerate kinase [Rhodospira trueperi]SDE06395.1 glycerate kinase [Rhodospira trueperi]
MRVVIAPDSFKGSATSLQVARAIESGLGRAGGAVDAVLVPLADGGEGTVAALHAVLGGEIVTVTARDPLDRPVSASYAWVPGRRLAVIEMAAASGLPLMGATLDPHAASSHGTGDLIRDALDRGAEQVILGLGGSATVDAGTGLLAALGARFLDAEGRAVRGAGGTLGRIAAIDLSGLDARARRARLTIASDVSSPLLGPKGAVAVFGPQKGVAEDEIAAFEAAMGRFSNLVVETTGRDVRDAAGSGAAGGIGYLLRSILDAETRDGFSLIAGLADLEARIAGADLVITGEGRLDAQSLVGKVPVSVARMARAGGVPTVALAGSVEGDAAAFVAAGLSLVVPVVDRPMTLAEAMADASGLIERAAMRLMTAVRLGGALAGRTG